MEAMKKSYHSACKEEKLAASRETNSKLESNNPEAQKKLQEKVEKCQQEVQKVGFPLGGKKDQMGCQDCVILYTYKSAICSKPTVGPIFKSFVMLTRCN